MQRKITKIRAKFVSCLMLVGLVGLVWPVEARADDIFTISDIVNNILASSADLPGILAAFAYLTGIAFAISGLIKLKDHVDDPRTPLKDAFIRLVVGGGMFALPYILDVMAATIRGGFKVAGTTDTSDVIGGPGAEDGTVSQLVGDVLAYSGNFSAIIDNILESIDNVPGLLAAFAYFLGILFAIGALMKLREHVDNPTQVALKDVVVRFLGGGMLLALPSVFSVLDNTISGGEDPRDVVGSINKVLRMTECVTNSAGNAVEDLVGVGNGGNMGDIFCNLYLSLNNFHLIIAAFAYVLAIMFVIGGVMKLRDHVEDARNTPILEPIKRFLAGGALFALPFVVDVMQSTITGGVSLSLVSSVTGMFEQIGDFFEGLAADVHKFRCDLEALAKIKNDDCKESAAGGLGAMLISVINSIAEPLTFVIMLFAYLAGLIFIVVGISRLTESGQQGAKGPAGFGTVMTFLTGGILLSMTYVMDAVSSSVFNMPGAGAGAQNVMSFSKNIADALSESEQKHVLNVINAVMMFLAVVGWISFVRGWFIIKEYADGSQQASLMAGATHIIGGAIAVNMGPFVRMVQNTLGVEGLA